MEKENNTQNRQDNDKICPLTGELVSIQNKDDYKVCIESNCMNVNPWSYFVQEGIRYRCELEKKEMYRQLDEKREKERQKELKTKIIMDRLYDSMIAAKDIDLKEFFALCDRINTEMFESRQEYSKDMVLKPYRGEEEKNLVYMFENGSLVEIAVLENVFTFLANKLAKLKDPIKKTAISCCVIPKKMADETNVRLRMINNLDIKNIIHSDNLVYLKDNMLLKYLDLMVGSCNEKVMRKLFDDPELTIIDYNGVKLYYKKEINDIINRKIRSWDL